MRLKHILILIACMVGWNIQTTLAAKSHVAQTDDGQSKETAILLDWEEANIVDEDQATWYRLEMGSLGERANEPVIALYLNNLSDQSASAQIEASAKFSVNLLGNIIEQEFSIAPQTYHIEGDGHDIWTLPTVYDLTAQVEENPNLKTVFKDPANVTLARLCELDLQIYMQVRADRPIAIATSVYEKEEIIDEGCTHSEVLDWKTGMVVAAGEQWLCLNLKEAKVTDKKLDIVVRNISAEAQAHVVFDLYRDCPASKVEAQHEWTIASGGSQRELLSRFLLNEISRDYVYLKLTTDQSVNLSGELGNDTVVWNEVVCAGECLAVGDRMLCESGHYEFDTEHADGSHTWNIVDLEVLAPVEEMHTSDTINEGEVYQWMGREYTESVTDTIVLQNAAGCDSILTLHLHVRNSYAVVTKQKICAGESYTWERTGETYWRDTVVSVSKEVMGSLIVQTLQLSVMPVHDTIVRVGICAGEVYTWDATGESYDENVEVTVSLTSIHGCDSVVTLQLTVHEEVPVTVESDTILLGEVYRWNGKEYWESAKDTIVLLSATNCDSVVVLDLTVMEAVVEEEVWEWLCYGDSLEWNGEYYSETGDYMSMLEDVYGRDSVVMLHLTVWPEVVVEPEYVSIKKGESYEWHGTTYDATGRYELVLKDEHDCDSILVLELTVLSGDELTIVSNEQCAGEGYVEFEITCTKEIEHLTLDFEEGSPWRDTIVDMPGSLVEIKNDARAGIYQVTATAYAGGVCVGMTVHELKVLYPASVLQQQWDDLIGVLTPRYNGGYDFVAFQWYKDGEPMRSQTWSYLSTPLEMGAEYAVELKDTSGIVLMSCPIVAEHQEELSVYPTVLTVAEKIHIRADVAIRVVMYNMAGLPVKEANLEAGTHEWSAPEAKGIYILTATMASDADKLINKKIVIR